MISLSLFDEFAPILQAVKDDFQENGVFFLSDDYLCTLQSKTNAFPRVFDELKKGAKAVANDEDAAKYALFVSRAMEDRELFAKNLHLFDFPDKDFPFLALLCFLPYIERLYDGLTEKGLPSDVIRDTVGQFEDCVFLYEERFGCLGFNKRYFDHMQRYVDQRILNIGRLRFELYKLNDVCLLESNKTGEQILFIRGGEMNSAGLFSDTPPINAEDTSFFAFFKETEKSYIGTPVGPDGRCLRDPIELDKSEYFVRVPFGADCLSVHIPAKGALTREACEESYARAIWIFKKHYPDKDFKAFRCHSWMMAPELKNILNPGSNLLDFQAPYLKYPCRTKGEDVLNFVFKMKFKSFSDLPEDTSLQRALKKIYLSGNYLYEYSGIIPIKGAKNEESTDSINS